MTMAETTPRLAPLASADFFYCRSMNFVHEGTGGRGRTCSYALSQFVRGLELCRYCLVQVMFSTPRVNTYLDRSAVKPTLPVVTVPFLVTVSVLPVTDHVPEPT